MKNIIKKILKEGDWDWVNYGPTEIPLYDYMTINNIFLRTDNNDAFIGLRVRISEDSQFYEEEDESNPIHDIGVIRGVYPHDSLPFFVYWPSINQNNTYDVEDLIVVG